MPENLKQVLGPSLKIFKEHLVNSVYQDLFQGMPIKVRISGRLEPAILRGYWLRDYPFFSGNIRVPQEQIESSMNICKRFLYDVAANEATYE